MQGTTLMISGTRLATKFKTLFDHDSYGIPPSFFKVTKSKSTTSSFDNKCTKVKWQSQENIFPPSLLGTGRIPVMKTNTCIHYLNAMNATNVILLFKKHSQNNQCMFLSNILWSKHYNRLTFEQKGAR